MFDKTRTSNIHIGIIVIYLGVFLAVFALQLVLFIVLDFDNLSLQDEIAINAWTNVGLYAIIGFFIVRYVRVYLLKNEWPKFKENLGHSVKMVSMTLGLMILVLLVSSLLFEIIGMTDPPQNQEMLDAIAASGVWYNLLALFAFSVLLAPVVEELVYRKGVYGLVNEKWGKGLAIFLSAFFFAIIHVLMEIMVDLSGFINILPYLGMGLALSFMYYYSGKKIFVPIFAHMIMNLITLTVMLFWI